MASPDLKSQSTVQTPVVMVKVRRDVVKVRRPGSQSGMGVPNFALDEDGKVCWVDADQAKWFSDLAASRGLFIKRNLKSDTPHLTFHNPMDIAVPKGEVQPGDVFVDKDGKSVSSVPVVENITIEVDKNTVLPTDVVLK